MVATQALPSFQTARFPVRVVEFEERGSSDSLRCASELIDACGLPDFELRVARAAKAGLNCDHVTCFSFPDEGAPNAVFMTSVSDSNPMREVSAPYVSRHWLNDPTNMFQYKEFRKDRIYLVSLSEDEVPDEEFRNDCYILTGVKHRASFLRWQPSGTVKLSFHRSETAGPFSRNSIDELLLFSDLLASLILKHQSLLPRPREGQDAVTHYNAKIGMYCPALTNREREVCSLIAIGFSSEGIALTLGLSTNTVLTFRRRAYYKLNISSQNELMRILL